MGESMFRRLPRGCTNIAPDIDDFDAVLVADTHTNTYTHFRIYALTHA